MECSTVGRQWRRVEAYSGCCDLPPLAGGRHSHSTAQHSTAQHSSTHLGGGGEGEGGGGLGLGGGGEGLQSRQSRTTAHRCTGRQRRVIWAPPGAVIGSQASWAALPQQSTAQHSTAQHSAAQHSTAQALLTWAAAAKAKVEEGWDCIGTQRGPALVRCNQLGHTLLRLEGVCSSAQRLAPYLGGGGEGEGGGGLGLQHRGPHG